MDIKEILKRYIDKPIIIHYANPISGEQDSISGILRSVEDDIIKMEYIDGTIVYLTNIIVYRVDIIPRNVKILDH